MSVVLLLRNLIYGSSKPQGEFLSNWMDKTSHTHMRTPPFDSDLNTK